ncbi:hypothetical protein [Natrinema zhouii]|uniref:hypothetical protein n=1 Tax=Natrinema zhouii TaxID=1710539 RepID=UPI003CE4513B
MRSDPVTVTFTVNQYTVHITGSSTIRITNWPSYSVQLLQLSRNPVTNTMKRKSGRTWVISSSVLGAGSTGLTAILEPVSCTTIWVS